MFRILLQHSSRQMSWSTYVYAGPISTATNLHKLEEDDEVRVDLQLPPILCHHVHNPLDDLRVAAGVDREAGWGWEVRVLLQSHCLVQVVLGCGVVMVNIHTPCHTLTEVYREALALTWLTSSYMSSSESGRCLSS